MEKQRWTLQTMEPFTPPLTLPPSPPATAIRPPATPDPTPKNQWSVRFVIRSVKQVETLPSGLLSAMGGKEAAKFKRRQKRRPRSRRRREAAACKRIRHRRNHNQLERRKSLTICSNTCHPTCLLTVRQRVCWRALVDITSEFQRHAWCSTFGEPHQGGYAGVRLGEAFNPGPAEHEHALTRRVTQFQEADVPAAQPSPH